MTLGRFILNGLGLGMATYVTHKCRLLAQLLIELKEKVVYSRRDLSSFIKPEHFDNIAKRVKELAHYSLILDNGYDEPSFKKGDLSLKMCYILENVRVASAVSHLSSTAKQTLDNNKFNQKIKLLVTPHLLVVKQYCKTKTKYLTGELKKNPTLASWRQLCQVCVT